MNRKFAFFQKLIALMALSLMTSACGSSNNWVTDADVRAYEDTGNVYSEVIVYLNTSGLSLPNLNLPIINPSNGAKVGDLEIRQSSQNGATTELEITVNISAIANIPGVGGNATLPNGSAIPVAGYNANDVLMLSVGSLKTTVYVSIDTAQNQAMMGAAVSISQFDSFGGLLGGANLFPSFQLGNGIQGTFGIFTGAGQGQNGFAVFLDVSGLLKNVGVITALAAGNSDGMTTLSDNFITPLEFLDISPSPWKKSTIEWGLYNLNRKKTKLTLE